MIIKIDHTVPSDFINETIIEKYSSIVSKLEQIPEDKYKFYTANYIVSYTVINLQLSYEDVQSISQNNGLYLDFLTYLSKIATLYFKLSEMTRDRDSLERDLNPLFLLYLTKDGKTFQFILNDFKPDYFIDSVKMMSTIIINYEAKLSDELFHIISKTHVQKDNTIFFENKISEWHIIQPLREVAKNISDKFYSERDNRSKKPSVIIESDDLNKKINVGNNWLLNFKKKDLFMSKPNDVALFCNISQQNLIKAKAAYTHLRSTLKSLHTNFPSEAQQKEIFDYFELVIQALIFSYTSLEAFANIIIPSNYEYIVESNGIKTIYSKDGIENKFHLRDKFKLILKDILKTEDVKSESWWPKYIELENIRNEIIHTKESTAEKRYNKLLKLGVFEIIEINQKVLKYYGNQIMLNDPYLINEYPVGFGFDETWPGLTSKKGFTDSLNLLNRVTVEEE